MEDGLYSYSVTQKNLEKVTPILDTKRIQAILQQSPTRIWIATEGAGLLLLNPKTKELKTYLHSSSDPKSISSNYIRSLALDSQNRLWIGTFNDLNIYHEASDSFVSYSSSPVESGSLSQRSVRSIFMDSQEECGLAPTLAVSTITIPSETDSRIYSASHIRTH
ncbi:hypothetical protein BFINE_49930 [Bacteroides finegoldii DSM 17565]|nr:hypothetical protein BFINE_49930 [Bacteroides finegoldii DSM 17565]